MEIVIEQVQTTEKGREIVANLIAHVKKCASTDTFPSQSFDISHTLLESLNGQFSGSQFVYSEFKVMYALDVETKNVIGVCTFVQHEKEYREFQVIDVYVAASHRRRGIASKLVDQIENCAKEYAKLFSERSWHVVVIATCTPASLHFWLAKKSYCFMRTASTKEEQELFDANLYKSADMEATHAFIAEKGQELLYYNNETERGSDRDDSEEETLEIDKKYCSDNNSNGERDGDDGESDGETDNNDDLDNHPDSYSIVEYLLPYCQNVYNGSHNHLMYMLPCVTLIKGEQF